VSPSWRDRIGVSLSPGSVALLRFARGWQPQLAHSEVARDDAEVDDAPGSVAVRLLASMLAGESTSKPADVSVVLSNHFVRYIMLPWSDVVSDEDWQALAQHQLRAVYGDIALDWATAVAWQGPERPVLACASPKVLLDTLHATVRSAGMRLQSVTPYFVAAFNFCRRRLPDDGFWFGVVEPGRCAFGGVEQGAWVSVASRRLAGDETPRLVETLEQEVLGGESVAGRGRAFVFSPEHELVVAEEGLGWSLERLSLRDTPSPVTDARFAAALTALA
jgi:hypothetical protein